MVAVTPTWVASLIEFLRVACEIGILTTLIYSALLFVRGTRASPILAGLVILMILLSLLSRMLGLDVMEFILMKTWTFLAVGALIIFQPEIRRAFAELGSQQTRLRGHHKAKREKELITVLLDAAYYLANHRNGALIAIEQNIGTRAIAETGTYINAPVSKELLSQLPNTVGNIYWSKVPGSTVEEALAVDLDQHKIVLRAKAEAHHVRACRIPVE